MLSCSGEGLYPGIAGALGCPRCWFDLSEWQSRVSDDSATCCNQAASGDLRRERAGFVFADLI